MKRAISVDLPAELMRTKYSKWHASSSPGKRLFRGARVNPN
jgi:hypothetical protein